MPAMAERQVSSTQGQAGGSNGGAAGSFAVVTLALVSGLSAWVGVVGAGMPIPIAMTLSLLGAATLGFIGGFVAAIHRGEWPRFETSWGGRGGGSGDCSDDCSDDCSASSSATFSVCDSAVSASFGASSKRSGVSLFIEGVQSRPD